MDWSIRLNLKKTPAQQWAAGEASSIVFVFCVVVSIPIASRHGITAQVVRFKLSQRVCVLYALDVTCSQTTQNLNTKHEHTCHRLSAHSDK